MHDFLQTRREIAALLLRTALFFVAANIVFAALDPMPSLARASLYNSVFPGRDRLPPISKEGVFSSPTYDIAAMFASHRIAQPAAPDEFRVVLVGDSTVRGIGMLTADTYAGRLNAARLRMPDSRRMRFYSLGIPGQSALRDALVIQYSMPFRPDLILWFVGVNTLRDITFSHVLVQKNRTEVHQFLDRHGISIQKTTSPQETWFDRTIIGRRQRLKQLIMLQLNGLMWTVSGLETNLNYSKTTRFREVLTSNKKQWRYSPPKLPKDVFRFDLMDAVLAEALPVPVIIINEPIRIVQGSAGGARYNSSHARWAYDQYREMLHQFAAERSAPLIDLWNLVPSAELVDNLHPSPAATKRIGEHIAQELVTRLGATHEP